MLARSSGIVKVEGCVYQEVFKKQLTFPEFHFETEAKVDFPSACIEQRRQKFE